MLEEGLVVQGGNRGGLRQRVDVERLADAVHQVRQHGLGDGKADAQAGQAIRLRQGARHHQVRILAHPRRRLVLVVGRQEFVVGLVQHDDDVRRHFLQEGFQLRGRQEGAGRVVRVGDKDQSRIVSNRRRHRVQVMAVSLRRHDDVARAQALRGQRVHGERILRVDDGLAMLHERVRGDFQDVVAAIAQGDPVGRHVVALGQHGFQVEAVGVRIAAQVIDGGDHRLLRRFRHAVRVFIRRQFDDGCLVEAKFARNFRDRLAALVRGDGADVFWTDIFRHGVL
ncbi:hypothetical protein D3C72_1059160 [compost metagenome]